MSRYIDVELLKNKILEDMAKAEREGRDCNGYTDALFHLKTIPSADVVEVVRCRDCKFRFKLTENEYRCTRGIPFYITCNDFCSYGERGAEE